VINSPVLTAIFDRKAARMSYTVHIKRAKDSVRRDADHISLEEWLVYVRSDDEMRLIGEALIKTPKGIRSGTMHPV
jgi:hypothetical protein